MDQSPPRDIDVSLLRVVVGYRLLAALWLLILGVITLAGGQSRVDRPWVVAVTMAGVTLWTIGALSLAIRRVDTFRSIWYLGLDVAVGVATLVSSDLAGTESFSGGYPLACVFQAIYALGSVAGLSAATALTITAFVRTTRGGPGDLTLTTGSVIVYGFSAVAAAWAVAILRRNDLRTRLAEEALATERAIRAKAETRSEMAAHLHDSVLQTLALIQRSPGDPSRVVSLARRQERDLRAWLNGQDVVEGGGLRAAVESMAGEIESVTDVRVEVVVVGDAGPSDAIDTLISATREAVINAAKHSGADAVDVYAEVAPQAVSVFVRDRGRGFDPGSIERDRRGISDSIVGRMHRIGGEATIRSAPGGGTEVQLEIPRSLV